MATFEYDGAPVDLISTGTLTVGELAFIRDAFGIDGLDVLDTCLEVLEPDALRAILAVSARRVNPDADPFDESIDAVVVRPLWAEVMREAMETLQVMAESDSQ